MDGQPPFTEHHSQPSLPSHRRPGPSVSQNAGIKYVHGFYCTVGSDNVLHSAQIGGIEGQPSVDVTGMYVNSGLERPYSKYRSLISHQGPRSSSSQKCSGQEEAVFCYRDQWNNYEEDGRRPECGSSSTME
jgi:hypothetical protein